MRVLVTGANGHIGFNLCRALVERGHTVRASVRSSAAPERVAVLRALGAIEIVEADVRRHDELREALSGIDVLMHLAAVYAYIVRRGHEDEDVVRPSVDGARNAMRAAVDARVAKVVLTSSVVTLPLAEPDGPPVTEEQWTTDLRVPYVRAKTLAEQEAWALARQHAINLVTVLPGAVAGPGFGRNTPTIDLFEGIMLGTMRLGAPDFNFPYVDVRDVVRAHVLACEQDCGGRFVACNDHLPSFLELIAAMHALDATVPRTTATIPPMMLGAAPFFDWLSHKLTGSPRVLTRALIATMRGKRWKPSNGRIRRELGWEPQVPLQTSLHDMMLAIRRKGAGRPEAVEAV